MQLNKPDFFSHLQSLVDHKVYKSKEYMESIEKSIHEESKSTAGDKHDTTRELMQQERNKAAQNLNNQMLIQKTLIQLLNNDGGKETGGFGSLIQTDKGWIFIGLAIGKVLFEEIGVVCISPLSPLAQVLEGCKFNDSLSFNNVHYKIQKVL